MLHFALLQDHSVMSLQKGGQARRTFVRDFFSSNFDAVVCVCVFAQLFLYSGIYSTVLCYSSLTHTQIPQGVYEGFMARNHLTYD